MEYTDFPISTLTKEEWPQALLHIPEPPKQLFLRGACAPSGHKHLAVVGSRNYSDYGKQVVDYLIAGLRGYPISIISGLARGMDTLAHKAALDVGLHTLSVPGSGLSDKVLYPRQNLSLAHTILNSGGGLLSEYEPSFSATIWSFPRRNRIMVGLADAVLLIEASEKSGTLITARLTAEYNRDLLAVPGNIFAANSVGVHQFIKLGATPVTAPQDILDALHLEEYDHTLPGSHTYSDEEQMVINLLVAPKDHDTLIRALPLKEEQVIQLLMHMELDGKIREQNGHFYRAT